MSDVTHLSNSTMLERIRSDIPTFAYAMAMRNDTFVDVGDRLFRAGLEDETVTPDIAAEIYSAIRVEAERIGRAKSKPLKDQTARSRASQASKLASFAKLATFARANDDVIRAYEWLRRPEAVDGGSLEDGGAGISTYSKAVTAVVAMNTALIGKPALDEVELRDIIIDALTPDEELASDAVEAVADAWEKLRFGDKTGPSPHADAFVTLLARAPANYAEAIATNLTAVVQILRQLEGEKAEKAAIAKASAANLAAA